MSCGLFCVTEHEDEHTPHISVLQVVSILSKRGRCERASIDEVYLDLTDAAETMLSESPPESLEIIDEEALKSHILGLNFEVELNYFTT